MTVNPQQIADMITEDPNILVENIVSQVLQYLPDNIKTLYGRDRKITYKIDEMISLAGKVGVADPSEIAREIIEMLSNLPGDYPNIDNV